VLMFQTHCYDSWLSPQARQSRFFMYSQLGGTFPGSSVSVPGGNVFRPGHGKTLEKDVAPQQIAGSTILRGAEIFTYGLLFRLQEYVISWGWAPKTDLLRMDVLNTIGLSMMLMGVLCWLHSCWVSRDNKRKRVPHPCRVLCGKGGRRCRVSLWSWPPRARRC
jgi:hypothetical protein